MTDLAIMLSVIFVSIILTLGLYYVLAVSWPRLYFGPSDGLEMFVSSRLILFATFRIGPVALISGAGFAYIAQLTEISRVAGPIAYFAMYGAFIISARVAHRVRHGRRLDLPDALWVITSVLLAGVGVLIGYALAPTFNAALPGIDILRDATITAVMLAAILGAARRFKLDGNHSSRAIRNAVRKYSATTTAIEQQGRKRGIDRWVVSAIFVAEQLQRPAWFQELERVLYSLGAPVTTGIFQTASKPSGAGTSEIIRYLEESPAATFASQYGGLGESRSHTLATMTFSIHNSSRPFVDLCEEVRRELISNEFDASYALSWAREFGLEFGDLRTSATGSYSFDLSVHSRIDNNIAARFKLAPSVEIDDCEHRTILPGETLQFSIYRHQLGDEWSFHIEGDGEVEDSTRRFIPLDTFPFSARWSG